MTFKEDLERLHAQRNVELERQEQVRLLELQKEAEKNAKALREQETTKARTEFGKQVVTKVLSPLLIDLRDELNHVILPGNNSWKNISLSGKSNFSLYVGDGEGGSDYAGEQDVSYWGYALAREKYTETRFNEKSAIIFRYKAPYVITGYDLIYAGQVNEREPIVTYTYGKKIDNGLIVPDVEILDGSRFKSAPSAFPKITPEELQQNISLLNNSNSELFRTLTQGYKEKLVDAISQLPEFRT